MARLSWKGRCWSERKPWRPLTSNLRILRNAQKMSRMNGMVCMLACSSLGTTGQVCESITCILERINRFSAGLQEHKKYMES